MYPREKKSLTIRAFRYGEALIGMETKVRIATSLTPTVVK